MTNKTESIDEVENSPGESRNQNSTSLDEKTVPKSEHEDLETNVEREDKPIKAKLIRTEGSLAGLPDGTYFFTLYADDFIKSSMNALKNATNDDGQQNIYRTVNERFHMLTVSVDFQKISA